MCPCWRSSSRSRNAYHVRPRSRCSGSLTRTGDRLPISMLVSVPMIPTSSFQSVSTILVSLGVRLGPSLKDYVERPLRRATNLRKPAVRLFAPRGPPTGWSEHRRERFSGFNQPTLFSRVSMVRLFGRSRNRKVSTGSGFARTARADATHAPSLFLFAAKHRQRVLSNNQSNGACDGVRARRFTNDKARQARRVTDTEFYFAATCSALCRDVVASERWSLS